MADRMSEDQQVRREAVIAAYAIAFAGHLQLRGFTKRFGGAPKPLHRDDGRHGFAVAGYDCLLAGVDRGVEAPRELSAGLVHAHERALHHVETVQGSCRTFVHTTHLRTYITPVNRW